MPNKGHFAALVYRKHSTDSGSFTQSTVCCLKLFAHLYTMLKINAIWEYASLFFFFSSLPFLFHTLDFVTCQSQINLIWTVEISLELYPVWSNQQTSSKTEMKYSIARLNSLQWQSCLHLKILFQKDYSLGIHFFSPA